MKWPTNGSLTPSARLKRRVDFWAVKLRVMPRVIRVQRMTRKWGSCSTAGTITLAIHLDDESEGFQDFVIVHELLHLKVPNHSRLFKALMTVHVPKWRAMDAARKGARGVTPPQHPVTITANLRTYCGAEDQTPRRQVRGVYGSY